MTNAQTSYKRVYVWEWPVRVFHWTNACSIILLAVTGYLIGNPVAISSSNEAYQHYWFGTVRFLHFTAAYIFFFNFLFRIYWSVAGNQYAKWNNFLPYTGEQRQGFLEVLKGDILLMDTKERVSIGHNPLSGLVYFIVFLVSMFEVITGFAVYSAMSSSWFAGLFAWIVPLMGGDQTVRQWHHLFMWFFLVFLIIHLYLSLYHDYIKGHKVISAMLGNGWKK